MKRQEKENLLELIESTLDDLMDLWERYRSFEGRHEIDTSIEALLSCKSTIRKKVTVDKD